MEKILGGGCGITASRRQEDEVTEEHPLLPETLATP